MIKVTIIGCATSLFLLSSLPAKAEPDDRRGDTPIFASAKHQKPSRARYSAEGVQFLPHPAGCPRREFCACGAAVKIFGRAIRKLWPSSAWLAMPRAAPGHLKVAARYGHVFVIDYMITANTAMVWDYNSGNHQSRYHVRSIAGFKIVEPVA